MTTIVNNVLSEYDLSYSISEGESLNNVYNHEADLISTFIENNKHYTIEQLADNIQYVFIITMNQLYDIEK